MDLHSLTSKLITADSEKYTSDMTKNDTSFCVPSPLSILSPTDRRIIPATPCMTNPKNGLFDTIMPDMQCSCPSKRALHLISLIQYWNTNATALITKNAYSKTSIASGMLAAARAPNIVPTVGA